MIALMLRGEHEIVQESYKKKLEIQTKGMSDQEIMERKMEPLVKILLRCRQYYESKYEIVRILVKAKQREHLLNKFEKDLDSIDSTKAKEYYISLLKDSRLLYNKIERLKVDNPMLNRPFFFN
jgi:hypothetical protein